MVLTHGAGSNCNSRLLIAVADAFCASGVMVYRYDLAFRRARPNGPPSPATAKLDRQSIQDAVDLMRGLTAGRVLAGGHSYGGRQTTMASAENGALADGLLLLSYPLHPPNHPEKPRTAHFPEVRTPALFVHGAKDPFGSVEEMTAALRTIPAPVDFMVVDGAGHDLGRNADKLAGLIAARAAKFLLGPR